VDKRILNFSAGPAYLPDEVMETVRDNILSYQDTGLGVMEFSHRGPEFKEIFEQTKDNLRTLLNLPSEFQILFTTGGATQQFSMAPLNLVPDSMSANYINTGTWSKKAIKEAKRFKDVNVCASSEEDSFNFIPTEYDLSSPAAYLHFTSNNTIFGTQFQSDPEVEDVPLVCDASSDFLSGPISFDNYGMIYAGAQKNLGPAGITVVLIRESLLERVPSNLPILLSYKTYSENDSMYNTIPTFPIYVVGEVLKWLVKQGGLEKMAERNERKAQLLYKVIDGSEFFRGTARADSRSKMNITFRLPSEELEEIFLKQAEGEMSGLKGHRSVGGIRASIYNAMPEAGVETLVSFMKEFEKKHG